MELLASLERELAQRAAHSLRRQRRVVETPSAPHVTVDGRRMLAFCSNDYLGLANHPRIVQALREGASRYGAGSGASHLISGHSRAHDLLEDRLAEFMSPQIEAVRTLSFCTGYMANLAILSAMAGRDAVIFSESLNHASLIDGARLSRAKVEVYPHGDTASLLRLLKQCEARTKLVVTDSVFSMDGDIAPLKELLMLCEQHGAWLVIDDAHGFGVLGRHGRGVLEHLGLRSPHIVYMGTLGKAAGVSGAFVAAHGTVIEYLLQQARPYIFTTAAPPALSHALLESLELIGGEEGMARRAQLKTLTGILKDKLSLRRWNLFDSNTPIQPVIIGRNEDALRAAASLQDRDIWVPAIRPPTVPADTARLRITLSASHTEADVQHLAEALNMIEEEQSA
jgi:8-amino-7-oxononanoate synthase